jgi:hypothetical protein
LFSAAAFFPICGRLAGSQHRDGAVAEAAHLEERITAALDYSGLRQNGSEEENSNSAFVHNVFRNKCTGRN